jgi:hypothetical protein
MKMSDKAKYEFSKDDESVFKSLSRYMLIFVLLIAAAGIATIINFATSLVTPISVKLILLLVEGILYCIMAVVFFFPIDNFKRVITTQGRDIDELLKGLNEFQKGVLLINIVTLATLVLYLIVAFS